MKTIVIAACLIALTIILSFVPFDNERQVVIKASLYDVVKQVNDLNNWKIWNPDLKNGNIKIEGGFNSNQSANITRTYSYLFHHINTLTTSLTRTINGLSTYSLIKIASVNDSTIAVSWNERLTIFELIKRNTIGHYSRQTNLDNLKKLMEDSNNKYGFFIKLVPVKDTLILTAESLTNNPANEVSLLYNELGVFIKENKLPAEKNYFYTTQLSNNKIAVGIPVYKQANNTENIKFLQLPANGRLVEGSYSGKIAFKHSIYNSINNFMLDQHLKQVAKPFEKYNIDDTILQPNTNINIKIYYPVF